MATRAEVESERKRQGDIRTLAIAGLVAAWKTLDLSSPLAVEQQLTQLLLDLVDSYGRLSASAAADFYGSLRRGVPGRFVPAPSNLDLTERVPGSARWAMSPLFPRNDSLPSPDKALERISGTVQRNVLQYGRQTIADNAKRDPADARWARVPTGEETCAWCRILASRGAVYESEQTAKYIGESKGKYHDWCDCQPIVVWRGSEWPEGYDPDKYMQQYQDALDDAPVRNINGIAAVMRKQLGVK